MTDALKRCPFCGSEAKLIKKEHGRTYQTSVVKCRSCPAETPVVGLDAECYWNRRTPEQRSNPFFEPELESAVADILEDCDNYHDGNYYNRSTMKPATMRNAIMNLFRPFLGFPAREPVGLQIAVEALNRFRKEHPLRGSGIITWEEAAQCCAEAWGLKWE